MLASTSNFPFSQVPAEELVKPRLSFKTQWAPRHSLSHFLKRGSLGCDKPNSILKYFDGTWLTYRRVCRPKSINSGRPFTECTAAVCQIPGKAWLPSSCLHRLTATPPLHLNPLYVQARKIDALSVCSPRLVKLLSKNLCAIWTDVYLLANWKAFLEMAICARTGKLCKYKHTWALIN